MFMMSTTSDTISTRERLIITSAGLFRDKGFHGTGLTEILKASGLPKGSLYHHFPLGKSDLAVASADWISHVMIDIIHDAFEHAETPEQGGTTLCFKLAKLFDIDNWQGCPIYSILFDGPGNEVFRAKAEEIFQSWNDTTRDHMVRLGMAPDLAEGRAEALMIAIEGAWVLARSRRSSDVLRRVPSYLYGDHTTS